jgi:hypothetical protein
MQKWEYLQMTQSLDMNGEKYTYYQNATKIPVSNIADYLNELGDEGWEMVNFESIKGRTYFSTSFYFKRSKA